MIPARSCIRLLPLCTFPLSTAACPVPLLRARSRDWRLPHWLTHPWDARCESMKRLHLVLSQMAHLTVPRRPEYSRSVHFPYLQQLVLCHPFMLEAEIGDFLAGCPILEMLAFIDRCGVPLYIDVICSRLKCLLLWQLKPLKLTVVLQWDVSSTSLVCTSLVCIIHILLLADFLKMWWELCCP